MLGSPDALLYAELDVGYRVPEQILALANGLLPHAGVDVAPTRSARATAAAPEIVEPTELRRRRRRPPPTALAAVHTSVAVIAPEELHAGDPRRRAARRARPSPAPISLLTPAESKGLEFDAVVVVEPGPGRRAGEHGVRLLYVALTRAVQHLTVIHPQRLPRQGWRAA